MLQGLNIYKRIFQVYTAQVINILISFVSGLVLVRILGKEGQGEWAIYQVDIDFFVLIITLGIPVALVHFLSSKKIQPEQLLGITTLLVVFGLAFMTAFTAWVQYAFPDFFPSFILANKTWFIAVILYSILVLKQQVLVSVIQSEKKFAWLGKMSVLTNSLNLVALCIIYLRPALFQYDYFFWITASLFLTTLIKLVIYTYYTYQLSPRYFSFPKVEYAIVKAIIQFGLLVFTTNFLQFFNYKMDIWFLNHYFHDKSAIGQYALAVTLAQLLWLFPSAVQLVLFQKISEHVNSHESYRISQQYVKVILVYCIPITLLAFVLSPYMIPWLFGHEFVASVPLFKILLIGIVPFCLSMPISGYFAGTNRVSINLGSALLGFMVCLIANFVFIPKYGATGAAWASVCSYLATLLFLFFMYYVKGNSSRS